MRLQLVSTEHVHSGLDTLCAVTFADYDTNDILQANAVSDKLLDLRSCVYTGKNLADKVLSGALVSEADFSKTVMSNVTMTKSYAKGANFSGMQAAAVLRVLFTGT